jgi:acetyltransferase-like isoleucine patch superfamily enzyme
MRLRSARLRLPRWIGLLIGITLPVGRLKNRLLTSVAAWSVHESARISHCVLSIERLQVGARCRIGTATVFRNMSHVTLADDVIVGNLCFFSASPAFKREGDCAVLRVDRQSAIRNRHYIDCSGGLQVGEFSVIAGCRSTILTHQLDLERNVQTISPVRIGDMCFVASNVSVVPGAYLPDRSVLAMGAVLRPRLREPGRLYGGVPARDLGAARNKGYTVRVEGVVKPARVQG